jgi:hypothetical protein
LQKAINTYQKDYKDLKVSLFDIPKMTDDEIGARNHPGKKAHERMAAILSEEIKNIL